MSEGAACTAPFLFRLIAADFSAKAALRPLCEFNDDAVWISDKGDPVQHLGMDGKAWPFFDFNAHSFKSCKDFPDVLKMEGDVLDAGGSIGNIDRSCGTTERREKLQHSAAGIEESDLHAVRHLLAQLQFQPEQTAIEFDRAVHIADCHADMFERFQHFRLTRWRQTVELLPEARRHRANDRR